MSNRILREEICTNEQIDMLSVFSETVYYRLIVNADDYGRFDGRMVIIRSRLFPLKNVTIEQIETAIAELVSAGLVESYTVDGKPFIRIIDWERDQRVRTKKPKYPAPVSSDRTCCQLTADDRTCPQVKTEIEPSANTDNICGHLTADDRTCCQLTADVRLNPIQSNPNPYPNPDPESESKRANARGEPPLELPEEELRPDFDTLEVYASNNLTRLSPGNMSELADFKSELPEELIRHAIDEACANGKPSFSYARTILMRYLEQGIKTLGDAKAAEARHNAKPRDSGEGRAYKWLR